MTMQWWCCCYRPNSKGQKNVGTGLTNQPTLTHLRPCPPHLTMHHRRPFQDHPDAYCLLLSCFSISRYAFYHKQFILTCINNRDLLFQHVWMVQTCFIHLHSDCDGILSLAPSHQDHRDDPFHHCFAHFQAAGWRVRVKIRDKGESRHSVYLPKVIRNWFEKSVHAQGDQELHKSNILCGGEFCSFNGNVELVWLWMLMVKQAIKGRLDQWSFRSDKKRGKLCGCLL